MTDRNEKLTESEFQPDDGRHWYVIHTYSGYENKVRQNLMHRIETMEMQDQIFRVIVPTEEEIEIKNGQRRTVHKKVFPGYVLVQMRMNDNSWYVVRNTPGVTSFVGHGNRPTPLDDNEVKAILKQMEEEAPKVRVSYQVGQAVKGGETVATVGNSGGNPDSGLYFELRHQGQPIDPMKWASLK